MGTDNPLRDAANMALELAEREAERALERLEQARARAAAVADFPAQPKSGSTIKFSVQYSDSGEVYTYVAWRQFNSGTWVVTGTEIRHTWAGLTELMMKDVTAKRLGPSFYVFEKGHWEGRKP